MKVDAISWKILDYIQRDGRVSIKTLAAEIGLSLPATSERVKRLEEAGVISGYRGVVEPESLGYNVTAVIGITAFKPEKARLIAQLESMPEVLECLHVTGADSYLLRVITRDLQHLEDFVGAINDFGETRTSVVMSQPIRLRPLCRMDERLK